MQVPGAVAFCDEGVAHLLETVAEAELVRTAAPTAAAGSTESAEAKPPAAEPSWAKQMRRKQQASRAVSTAAHALRSGDHGGSGASPSLRDDSNT